MRRPVLTSELTQLAPFQGSLWVVPASEIRSQSIHSARDAKRAFGVNLVVSGSFQRSANSIRLTANLIDAVTQRQLRLIDERIDDVSVLQDRLVAEIASMLDLQLRPQALQLLASGKTAAPAAYDFYLQGYGYLRRLGAADNADDAIRLFQQALKQDPDYALAYAGLGEAYWRKYLATRDSQWVDEARANCRRAAQINDRLAAVHAVLGLIQNGTGHYDKATREYQRAVELDSGNADAWTGLAAAYESTDKLPEAEATYKKAIELRPGYWAGYSYLARYYFRHGRAADAEPLLERVIELAPDNYIGYRDLGGVYSYVGQYDKAADMLERAASLKPMASIYSNIGTARFSQSCYREAVTYFEKAAALAPNDYLIVGNLADA